jgi:hypothetical protein
LLGDVPCNLLFFFFPLASALFSKLFLSSMYIFLIKKSVFGHAMRQAITTPFFFPVRVE